MDLAADRLEAIAHIIQLAVAPVFLIAGVGALLGVMTTRLGRVVDRARELERSISSAPEGASRDACVAELGDIDRRMAYANRAIALSTVATLLICLVVAVLFLSAILEIDASRFIAALFVATMAALVAGLCFFLAEIAIATRTLRVRSEVLRA